jgi:hypothetical protein
MDVAKEAEEKPESEEEEGGTPKFEAGQRTEMLAVEPEVQPEAQSDE